MPVVQHHLQPASFCQIQMPRQPQLLMVDIGNQIPESVYGNNATVDDSSRSRLGVNVIDTHQFVG